MPFYFSAKEDVLLLREAVAQGMVDFDKVAKEFSKAVDKIVTKRTVKESGAADQAI